MICMFQNIEVNKNLIISSDKAHVLLNSYIIYQNYCYFGALRILMWQLRNDLWKFSFHARWSNATMYSRSFFEAIQKVYENQVIGLGYRQFAAGGSEWSSYSPDLNPWEFFLIEFHETSHSRQWVWDVWISTLRYKK